MLTDLHMESLRCLVNMKENKGSTVLLINCPLRCGRNVDQSKHSSVDSSGSSTQGLVGRKLSFRANYPTFKSSMLPTQALRVASSHFSS